MRHSKFKAVDPIKQLSTRELLAAIIGLREELSLRGSLADAPTDITDGLDAGDTAAREALEWLSDQEPACMSRADWSGASSYPGVP